jgi:hypothetical protein
MISGMAMIILKMEKLMKTRTPVNNSVKRRSNGARRKVHLRNRLKIQAMYLNMEVRFSILINIIPFSQSS